MIHPPMSDVNLFAAAAAARAERERMLDHRVHSAERNPVSTDSKIRYVTVAGAHVTVRPHPDQRVTQASCDGCGQYENTKWHLNYVCGGESNVKCFAEELTRKWAQAHAEKCRALPRD